MSKKIKSSEGVDLPKKENCDRCGNDLSKGTTYLHFPYIKLYIGLCHICLAGLQYGFFRDIVIEMHNLHKI